jgi:2-polyprenyl-3-methyl-5-hydroxy-6-metoxy-1,4-benzoquinol methylase
MRFGNQSNPEIPVEPAGPDNLGQWKKDWSKGTEQFTQLENCWRNAVANIASSTGQIHVVDTGSGNGYSFFSIAESLATKGLKVIATLVDLQPAAFIDLIQHIYFNPKYQRNIVYFTNTTLEAMVSDSGFTDIELATRTNPRYPNGLNDDNFPDNYQLLAKK